MPLTVPSYGETLRALHERAPDTIVDSLANLVRATGALDVVAYLIDFEQRILLPIPDRAAHADLPVGESVSDTMAGRAFSERRVLSEPRERRTRVWTPILEGSDCTGVLALTLDGPLDVATLRRCEELGMLAGAIIFVAARYTDLYNLVRRRKAMSLPASLQWDLLPPLRLKVPQATSTGVLEPAYDVGGDCFDHAVNGVDLELAIMDAMGHGLKSSLLSGLALGSYRHDRREGQPLGVMHEHIDRALSSQFDGEAFVTGQLARLELSSGELTWINAGHPLPLLIRDGRFNRFLDCIPSQPWGLGGLLQEQRRELLEPGDVVVFYTDGVVEGRSPAGKPFGVDRFIDLIEQAAAATGPSSTVLHRLISDVLEYQDHRLRDDATIIWLSWDDRRLDGP